MTPHEHEHAHDTHGGAAEDSPRILLFYDYACPFCYVDQFRFDRLDEEFGGLDVVLIPFELRPDMPEEGYHMSEIEAEGHSNHVEEHLLRVAAKDGIPMQMPPFLPKTHRAIVMAELARDRGAAEHRKMHRAILGAYFAEGLDIGSPEVLLALAREQGLDVAEVEAVWADERYDERVHEFRHVAMGLGLDATPAALICSELLIGSRPYQVLRDSIERCLEGRQSTEAQDE
jgi:predicted DsbA family dithiol-disulfide isomerase